VKNNIDDILHKKHLRENSNMRESEIKTIVSKGEGLRVEFKECKTKLSKEVYETVSAFLNRFGGELLMGVKDNGDIVGVDENCVEKIKKEFITAVNNPQKISPSFYLSAEEVKVKSKTVIYVYVPESSQVHRCNGRIFDRNEDGDFDITDNTDLVTNLYIRKQATYSENRIYPFIKIKDLKASLIQRVRKLAIAQKPGHLWSELDDFEMLKSAQLYLKDYQSGKKGFTLAAVLLFGKDEVISSILPHFRTDAIVRKENLDRYDDRDDIRTNLIESYDRLMAFTEKHLPDKFYIENKQRINLRDHIFREVITNILIHREYTNAFPAKFVIEKDKVYTENSNKPHGHGLIDPSHFSPFPKNPVIAKIFKEIGRADELGSGIRTLFKYSKVYSGMLPQLIEEDIFKIVVPLTAQVTVQATVQATMQATMQADRIKQILYFCKESRTREEIQNHIGIQNRDYFRKEILNPLIIKKFIFLTIPDKPNSPKQKYYSAR